MIQIVPCHVNFPPDCSNVASEAEAAADVVGHIVGAVSRGTFFKLFYLS